MVGAMDPYRGSLHCVRTLIVPLLTQMYKWVLVTELGGAWCSKGNLNRYAFNFSFNTHSQCIGAI